MPHNFAAMAAALKDAVRWELGTSREAELLVAKLQVAGSTSPLVGAVADNARRSVDTLSEAYSVIKALADGKLQLVEVRQ